MDLTLFTFLLGFGEIALPVSDLDLIFGKLLIYELYLDPVCQGVGFGEHLFEGCRHALDMRKLRGLIVWALLDNTPACDFYWRRGGRPVASTFTKIGGAKLEKVAFTWR